MTTPIKTLIMNDIKTAVSSVIGTSDRVFVDPSRGLQEALSDPYANIFTDAESSKKLDLYSEKSFTIEIHIWVKEDTDDKAREKAILLSAQLQQAILPRSSVTRTYCTYIEEADGTNFDVMYYEEGYCVALSQYQVRYRHTYGNPFQLNP